METRGNSGDATSRRLRDVVLQEQFADEYFGGLLVKRVCLKEGFFCNCVREEVVFSSFIKRSFILKENCDGWYFFHH